MCGTRHRPVYELICQFPTYPAYLESRLLRLMLARLVRFLCSYHAGSLAVTPAPSVQPPNDGNNLDTEELGDPLERHVV